MLDRLRSLVTVDGKETGAIVEDLQKQMVKKAMELALAGGFHYHEPLAGGYLYAPYDYEWFQVCSTDGSNKFRVFINRSSFEASRQSKIDQYFCRVYANLKNEAGIFWLSYYLADGQVYLSRFDQTASLDWRQRESILRSFLSSNLDVGSTKKHYENARERYREEITKGGLVVEWVSDMQPETVITGLLRA